MRDAVEQFRDAIRSAGLEPPEVIEPGKLHRFPGIGKRNGNTAGWCKLFDDGLGGCFGDWSSGFSENWQAKRDKPYTLTERTTFKRHVAEAQAQTEAERKAKQTEAAAKAATIWAEAAPADSHPYLTAKGIKAHGARLHGDALVIPMRDSSELHSLQFINTDGMKRFLSGGRGTGCYFAIGKTQGSAALCIAEGFATGATIHEATGYPVAVAFNAGNLASVAKSLRQKFPELPLIVCADDDYRTDGNPGKTKATEAVQAVGGLVAVPVFSSDRPAGATDFNDMGHAQGLDAVQACIEAARAKPPTGSNSLGVAFRCMADVEAKPIDWLWPGKIARGKVTMLAGNPGLGKSQVTASMAAIVTTGGQWPVDRTRCKSGAVVFLSAEDDAADTIKPRLVAAGADAKRVFVFDAVWDRFNAQGEPISRHFNLKKDLAKLGALLEQLSDVAMIVIDPITAYLGETDSHRNAEVRALLAPLAELAARHGAAVVCVSHLNKGGNSEALMRVTGSLAFVAAARAAFIVARDRDDNNRRLFLPLKNNIGKDASGLAFAVESRQLPCGIETSCVAWESEAVMVTADEALVPEGSADDRSELQEATDWLRQTLVEGPLSAKDVQRQADQAGFTRRTIRRAKDVLGIKPAKTRFDGGWEWKLPPKVAKSAEDVQSQNVDTFGEVGHLRQATDDAEIF